MANHNTYVRNDSTYDDKYRLKSVGYSAHCECGWSYEGLHTGVAAETAAQTHLDEVLPPHTQEQLDEIMRNAGHDVPPEPQE